MQAEKITASSITRTTVHSTTKNWEVNGTKRSSKQGYVCMPCGRCVGFWIGWMRDDENKPVAGSGGFSLSCKLNGMDYWCHKNNINMPTSDISIRRLCVAFAKRIGALAGQAEVIDEEVRHQNPHTKG